MGVAPGTTGFVGEGSLQRNMTWTFNADSGQLLILSLEQQSSGTNQLPQGQVQLRQAVRMELSGA